MIGETGETLRSFLFPFFIDEFFSFYDRLRRDVDASPFFSLFFSVR